MRGRKELQPSLGLGLMLLTQKITKEVDDDDNGNDDVVDDDINLRV